MKKTSSIDRVVGNLSDFKKAMILHKYAAIFNKQNNAEMHRDSRSKTRDQLQIIREVNTATNALRRKYGLEDFDVPENNVHIIKEEVWGLPSADWLFSPEQQCVFVKETTGNIRFAANVFRGMVQFKSYGAVQKTGPDTTIPYRTGFVMLPRSDVAIRCGLKYFQELNDAVVEELTVRYIQNQSENPLFKKEGLAFFPPKAEREALLRGVERTARKSFFNDLPKDDKPIDMGDALREVAARKDAVLDAFISPMFTGHLFALSRLLDKAHRTKGNLRKIATPDEYAHLKDDLRRLYVN